ncbi:sedoheptulokinase isoform X2 [Bufo gargarizans]|uniref:sedoheptulokinase isoform X2 n=1 Tax=Bufo gargarizans TaxID=30331 RepID=UPI001CF28E16|nr:sedoheptulokinase isoform X2 [Bufo gargarizans]
MAPVVETFYCSVRAGLAAQPAVSDSRQPCEMELEGSSLVLGIDVGTSSVKAVLLEPDAREVLHQETRDTRAGLESECGAQGKEQDVCQIIRALNDCLAALPRERLRKVSRIGVSGQMHGVLFWRTSQACHWINSENLRVFEPKEVSRLVTWEDGRCTTDFLSSLPQPQSHLNLASGFGCTSVFWYLKHRPEVLQQYDAAGTIQDYVVSMLCGLQKPLMSVQNAASWGLGDFGFPLHLLPNVLDAGCLAGKTSYEWCGIPQGTEVGVALGDFQCSVYSSLTESTDAVLNISTSAQLTFCMPEGFQPEDHPSPAEAVTYFPYFKDRYLAVAASLNGGNVFASFVTTLAQWTAELGLEISDSDIYSRVINAALSVHDTHLTISPTLFGERHAPDSRASVSSLTPANLSLGHVTRALCRGIIENIYSMLPSHRLKESGIQQIVGSGGALARNAILKQEVERVFPFPVVYGKDVDSAVGAAMVMVEQ